MDLKDIEWSGSRQGQGSGPMSSGGNGPMVRCCPKCRGVDPSDPNKGHFIDSVIGHRDGCEIKKEIDG